VAVSVPIRTAPPRRVQYAWGPVRKQRDRVVSINTAQDAAVSVLNCWIRDADTDFPIVEGRPGFVIADESMGSSAAVQWVGQLSKADGTEVSAVVAAGEIWSYNHGTDTLTKVVTTANLTTATVTLSSSARVYACEFADTLVFNDGVNQPFTWDGTSGAGGVTLLSNAPSVCYGKPWVYYAKLWFIKNAERNTVVWSEEGTANTGYEAGGYTNAWTLRQTATEGFVAGEGTNEGLYLFRGNSTTLVTGEVTPNFSTTGVDEGISDTVGCRSPNGVLNLGGALYFLTNDRRILRVEGRQLVDVGIGARARLASLNTAQIAKVFVDYVDFHEQGERIVVAIPETGSDDCNAYVIVNPASGLCEGTWTGWKTTALGRWKNADGEWRLVHGGGDAATTVDDGLVYIHDVPNGDTLDDEFLAGLSPITHQTETSYIGPDVNTERGWTDGTLLMSYGSEITGVSATAITSRGEHALTTALEFDGAAGFTLDEDQLDIDALGGDAGEARIPFAMRGVFGRWLRMRFAHATLGERFTVQELTINATVTERRPSIQ
jgi:hypothetical protein